MSEYVSVSLFSDRDGVCCTKLFILNIKVALLTIK